MFRVTTSKRYVFLIIHSLFLSDEFGVQASGEGEEAAAAPAATSLSSIVVPDSVSAYICIVTNVAPLKPRPATQTCTPNQHVRRPCRPRRRCIQQSAGRLHPDMVRLRSRC